MENRMLFRCPGCRKKYDVPARHLGKKFDCVKCGKRIRTSQSAPPASNSQSDDVETTEPNTVSTTASPAPEPPIQPALPTSIQPTFQHSVTQPSQKPGPSRTQKSTLIIAVAGIVCALVTVSALGIIGYYWASKQTSQAKSAPKRIGVNGELVDGTPQPRGDDFSDDARYVSQVQPAVWGSPRLDPTIYPYSPHHLGHFPDMQLNLDYGLSFGGTKFLAAYDKGMRSSDPKRRLDSAIAAANWGHNLDTAIPTILSTVNAPKITSDGRFDRLSYAYRILNHYPKQVESSLLKLLSEGSDGYVSALESIVHSNRYSAKLIRAASDGLLRNAVNQNLLRSKERAFRNMLGYSAIAQENLPSWFALDPKEINGLVKLNSFAKYGYWKESGGNPNTARVTALDQMPPMLNEVSHLNLSRLRMCESMRMRFGPVTMEMAINNRLVEFEAFLAALQYSLNDVDAITTGKIELKTTTQATEPRLVFIRFNSDLDPNRLKNLGVASGEKTWRCPWGMLAFQTSPNMLVIGTDNEVRWCQSNQNTPHVHPGVLQWPEIDSAVSFEFDHKTARVFHLEQNSHQAQFRIIDERFFDIKNNFTAQEWARFTTETSLRVDEVKKGFQQRLAGFSTINRVLSGNEKISQQALDEITMPTVSDIVRGSRQTKTTDGHFALTCDNGQALTYTDVFDAGEDLLGQTSEQPSLPSETKSIERELYRLTRIPRDTIKYQKYFAEILDMALKKFAAPDQDSDIQTTFPTVETVNSIARLLSPEHIDVMLKIGEAIQFPDGQAERTRWLVSRLSQIHDSRSVFQIERILSKPEAELAFDLEVIDPGGKLAEQENEDFDEPDSPLMQRSLTLERLGLILDYYLAYGDSDIRKACLMILKKMPSLKNKLAYRVCHLRETSGLSPELIAEIDQIFPVAELSFHVPTKEPKAHATSFGSNWHSAEENEVEGNATTFEKLKLFAPRTASFQVMLPIVDEDQRQFKCYGRAKFVEQKPGESTMDWVKRRRAYKPKPDEYELIEGFRMAINHSDAIRVDTLSRDVDDIKKSWKSANLALGSSLIREEKGDSGADFDRIRYFYIGSIPKAERIIAWRDQRGKRRHNKFGFRWIGRNQTEHPDYVETMINSFSVK